jgi:hypothetical protein
MFRGGRVVLNLELIVAVRRRSFSAAVLVFEADVL